MSSPVQLAVTRPAAPRQEPGTEVPSGSAAAGETSMVSVARSPAIEITAQTRADVPATVAIQISPTNTPRTRTLP